MSLFNSRNPFAQKRKVKKNTPNCTNCPFSTHKKECLKSTYSPAQLLIIHTSNKESVVIPQYGRKINEVRKRFLEAGIKSVVVPDMLCEHNVSKWDEQAHSKLNLHCSYTIRKLLNHAEFVICIGKGSLRALMGEKYGSPFEYDKVHGSYFRIGNKKVFTCIEPEDSEVSEYKAAGPNSLFERQLLESLSMIGDTSEYSIGNLLDRITVCSSEESIDRMKDLLESPIRIAIDYETTGLRPYMDGHRILSCAIATSPTECFSFLVDEKNKEWLAKVVKNYRIPKICANAQFEQLWSRVYLKDPMNNVYWDTVIAAHILDPRKGIASVKFQGALRYGIYGYDKSVEAFISSNDKDKDMYGENAMNSLASCDTRTLLLYNGMDSILEYMIAIDQMIEMGQ